MVEIISYYFICAFKSQEYARYMMPILPFICIWLAKNKWVSIGAIIIMLPTTLYTDWLMCQKDTRTIAKEWIEANVVGNVIMDNQANGPRVDRRLLNCYTTEVADRGFSNALPHKDAVAGETLVTFSPYWDSNKKEGIDKFGTTCVPHLPRELFSRRRLGPHITISEAK